MTLEPLRKGKTRFFSYDYDAETISLFGRELTFKEAKQLKYAVEEVMKRRDNAPPPTAPDDLISIKPPWILRKFFGWQNVIKKA